MDGFTASEKCEMIRAVLTTGVEIRTLFSILLTLMPLKFEFDGSKLLPCPVVLLEL